MVPGSTCTSGWSFWRTTFCPRDAKRRPSEAVVMPLPRPEATPPVTNTYLVCSFTTGPDCSRRRGLRCAHRRRFAPVGSPRLRPHLDGLVQKLLSMRQRVLGRLHPRKHPRALLHAVGTLQHECRRGALPLANANVQVGEARDLRQVRHDKDLVGGRVPTGAGGGAASLASRRPTASPASPPMPASISSNTSVGTSSRAARTL